MRGIRGRKRIEGNKLYNEEIRSGSKEGVFLDMEEERKWGGSGRLLENERSF